MSNMGTQMTFKEGKEVGAMDAFTEMETQMNAPNMSDLVLAQSDQRSLHGMVPAEMVVSD